MAPSAAVAQRAWHLYGVGAHLSPVVLLEKADEERHRPPPSHVAQGARGPRAAVAVRLQEPDERLARALVAVPAQGREGVPAQAVVAPFEGVLQRRDSRDSRGVADVAEGNGGAPTRAITAGPYST